MRFSRSLLGMGAALSLAFAGPANAFVPPFSGTHVLTAESIIQAKGASGGRASFSRVASQSSSSSGGTVSRASPPASPPPASRPAYTAPPPSYSSGGTVSRATGPATSPAISNSTSTPVGGTSGTVSRAANPPPVAATGTVSRVGAAPSGQATAPVLPRSEVDRAITRGQSQTALAAFKADQTKFAKPPVGTPQTASAARTDPVWNRYGSNWHNADDYYSARNRSIAALPSYQREYWTHPPLYVLHSAPAYGSYSGAFLGGLLIGGATVAVADAMSDQNARWAYAHRNDPAYVQWHDDMMSQAQENAELRQRLDALDRQVGVLQERNAVVNPDELPPGVDPSLVVAPETAMLATAVEPTDRGLLWPVFGIGIGIGLLVIFGIYRTMNRSRLA